jgi:hypothetical protein
MDYNEWKFQQVKDEMQPSYEKSNAASSFSFMIFAFFLWSMILFLENWMLMIFIGTMHSVFNFIPAAGFWTVLWFNILGGIIIGIIQRNLKVLK